ncbi:DNA polymerase III subunit chi [Kaistia geumhonensis]|uniref:DNA polymerase-3 subunit chi n=1 Tax=Kaistia geumhonensis TaxID=410839 RepID=A0ABU0M2Q0_9HYPH|nr:DNA polymerase III subunit chi [Kaistia geumhonensis]MCX5479549.1 DNA polymerase III subunit chi [Kaistia geumhonensis]MDQ0515228.1 DNA polymerase-3 subunit chi [Kaistia geumhonensis]
MSEVLFYHLERQPLDAVLPPLLEKCLERGWKVVVEAGSRERVEALDAMLWTWREESFLPHGLASDANAPLHPIVLATDGSNPNGATVRFAVDGAPLGAAAPFDRVVLIFDGSDPDAIEKARQDWRRAKTEGHAATYWQQGSSGRWEKRA